MSTQIQLTQLQMTFKNAKCPAFFADAPLMMWSNEGVMHVQFRSAHITDPTTGSAEFSPLVEVVMPLSAFFQMQDAANDQAKQLEKQGVKRVPIAAVTPTAPGGSSH